MYNDCAYSPPPAAGNQPDMSDWYAVRVNANSEHRTANALKGKGFDSYLPQFCQYRCWGKRVRKVQRALFPGYVFACFNPNDRLPILTIPGVAYIVGTSQGPLPVDVAELAAVRKIAESDALAEPYPFLTVGDWVALADGPLRGLRGRLVSLGPDLRVVVSISLLQRSIAVAVDRRWLRPAGEGEWDYHGVAMSYPA